MLNESARGVYIISVTPFDDRGALDLDGTDRLIDFYMRTGIDGITILGMMGEAPKLGHDEAVAFARRVIARAGKLPVVVGVSAPGLASLAALTRDVMDLGAAAALGCPTVALFGTAPSNLYRPGGTTTPAVAVTGMVDGRQNILGITPKTVIESWLDLLNTVRAPVADIS